jgi:osmotically-inducible protein OsmY
MKTDSQIQIDVRQALSWDPSVTHELVGVTALNGVVTLSGSVPSYFEKTEAETVAQRIGGVKAVVQNIEVKLSNSYFKDDKDIADAILSQFKWNFSVPNNKIKIEVEKGWVELKGEVEWGYQKTAAENCIKDLIGVKGVSNFISIKPKNISASDIKQKIEDALKSEAKRQAGNISVGVDGGKVTLSGDVHSFAEMDDAKWAAWGSPGVTDVTNNMQVNYPLF